jgi:hypothetical protein
MTPPSPDQPPDQKIAFDYAWGYFALHAGQRMQSVNFFLVAVSFLAAAYVSAMVNKQSGLAAGISLVGASSSFVFYRIERRIRGLLHAAERALRPMENEMAAKTANPALRILESVDSAAPGAWPYSKVFRILYAVVGLGFGAATIYSIVSQLAVTPDTTSLFPTVLKLASGVVLLLFAAEILASRDDTKLERNPTRFQRVARVVPTTLAVIAAIAGIIVLFNLGVRG